MLELEREAAKTMQISTLEALFTLDYPTCTVFAKGLIRQQDLGLNPVMKSLQHEVASIRLFVVSPEFQRSTDISS